MEEVGEPCRAAAAPPSSFAAEIPRDPMELLSRSWSVSALEVSKTLAPTKDGGAATAGAGGGDGAIVEEELELEAAMAIAAAGNPFSFATSATSQLVMERIMAQSQEVSPRTSGRLSHSSGPLNGGHSCGSLSDSPPFPPPTPMTSTSAAATGQQYRGGSRTVGRWLKDRRERKKEETRAHNAQVHAAVSVAGVAAAVAAIAAATAISAPPRGPRTDMAVASAATLVAAQCVEAAEAMGAARDHLASVVSSAVNVRTRDIITLTPLRAAATLKARTLKEVWNIAAVTPVDKGQPHSTPVNISATTTVGSATSSISSIPPRAASAGAVGGGAELPWPLQPRAPRQGTELLKRTRKGALHWKVVSVYINKTGQVMLKMKSKHVAGTITKKKKNAVAGVCRDVAAWPGRHLLDGGEQRRYFGLRTAERRVIEFECRSQREYDLWTSGVERLLAVVADKPSSLPERVSYTEREREREREMVCGVEHELTIRVLMRVDLQ
ncbi:unnamed protein product [Spirodela intermedia]|uniref:Uncharacterized protein n=1 Tax=Spirodela intermedia TaxID=51605 RepID=A0A7I8JAT1_SPIIN|nr:unnamed protein product [Spirodela intermedia]CAA6667204.1 unnamed protein product [Spirodela intermedia]